MTQKSKIKISSNRNFGLVFFTVFFIISLWPFVPSGNFFNNYLSILIYFPLGFLIYLVYSKNYSIK